MKVALVYDRLNKWGGAERVLLALHKLFPDAPLYTSIYNPKTVPWAKVFNIKTSFLQGLPFTTNHELFAILMPLAFENFSFDEYDLVISVTSEAAKGIITKPNTLHICYCLTPTRYLWSGYNDYFGNKYLRFFSKPIISYLRWWDKIATQRPDYYIAISKEVKRRIKRYYGKDSEVVYPPVQGAEVAYENSLVRSSQMNILKEFKMRYFENFVSSPRQTLGSYFLIVSRLVPYKKIDLAIRAFNKLKFPLKIVGIGSEMKKLKSIAGPTIEFLGYLTDEELVGYYRECIALVFPTLEDFGLTILEAQSFGKPVIAFKGGGALETVINGKTGEFFYPHNEDALIRTVKKFNQSAYNPLDCLNQARKFNNERFKKKFMAKIEELSRAYKKNL